MVSRLRNWFARTPPQPESPPNESVAQGPQIVDVTDADFGDEVLNADRLAVVDFWADWCQPCTIMSAHVGFLLQEFGDQLLVAALDVEENPETPATFSVQGLPTLIMFRDGAEIDRQIGVTDYESLRDRVGRLLAETADSIPQPAGPMSDDTVPGETESAT